MSTSGPHNRFLYNPGSLSGPFPFPPQWGTWDCADVHNRSTVFLMLKMCKPETICPHKVQEENKIMELGTWIEEQLPQKKKRKKRITLKRRQLLLLLTCSVSLRQPHRGVSLRHSISTPAPSLSAVIPNNPPAGTTNQDQIITLESRLTIPCSVLRKVRWVRNLADSRSEEEGTAKGNV